VRERVRRGDDPGPRSGGRSGGSHLTDAAGVLRPAVEAALAVARDGLTADPPVAPPPALTRYVGFKKLSAPAIQAIARVVEGDDEFRARVAAAVDEESVGRAGLLWLRRPDGWADELAELVAQEAHQAADRAEARSEKDARRRLASAKAAAARANESARAANAKVDQMRSELGNERSRRVAAEQVVADLEADLAHERGARADLERRLRQADERAAKLGAQVEAARAELAEQLAAEAARGPGDLQRFHEAVHAVARRAAALADEVRALEETTVVGPGDDLDRVAAGRGPGADPPPSSNRREPVPLPPGLRDDSVDVVDHLLRSPGMLLLVDGYNVSMVGWPDMPVREQRRRLLTALEEKALRTGAPIEVVFDGIEVDAVGVRGRGRPLVRVRFSPPGVEADDVVLDMVAQLPVHRPVTVASSDNRVRDGARARGANLLHSRQLVAALRR
jgi:predicted RNA-binding protein with PIN domain